jgi:hypothetical protein
MAIAIGVVALVAIVVFLAWTFRQDVPETAMGRENRLRREAKKAQKRGIVEEDAEDGG